MRHQHAGPYREGLNDVADNRYQPDERAQRQYILERVHRSGSCRDLRREQRPGSHTAPVAKLADRGPGSAAAILVAYATFPPFFASHVPHRLRP